MTRGDELDLLAADVASELSDREVVLQILTRTGRSGTTGRDIIAGMRSFTVPVIGFQREPFMAEPGREQYEQAIFDVEVAAITGGTPETQGTPDARVTPDRDDAVIEIEAGGGGRDVVWLVHTVTPQVGRRVWRLTCRRKRG